MSGINFDGNIHNIANVGATGSIKATSNQQTNKVGAFGFGYTDTNKGFSRTQIPQALIDKFENVQYQKYERNVGQLVIKDTDYIPDASVYDNPYCEV